MILNRLCFSTYSNGPNWLLLTSPAKRREFDFSCSHRPLVFLFCMATLRGHACTRFSPRKSSVFSLALCAFSCLGARVFFFACARFLPCTFFFLALRVFSSLGARVFFACALLFPACLFKQRYSCCQQTNIVNKATMASFDLIWSQGTSRVREHL
jgi:hypothetical protein